MRSFSNQVQPDILLVHEAGLFLLLCEAKLNVIESLFLHLQFGFFRLEQRLSFLDDLLHKVSESAHFFVFVFGEVKLIQTGVPQLLEVVLEGLPGNTDLRSSVVQRELFELTLNHGTLVVESAPLSAGADNFADGAFLGAFAWFQEGVGESLVRVGYADLFAQQGQTVYLMGRCTVDQHALGAQFDFAGEVVANKDEVPLVAVQVKHLTL